jgi:hypothetical protein
VQSPQPTAGPAGQIRFTEAPGLEVRSAKGDTPPLPGVVDRSSRAVRQRGDWNVGQGSVASRRRVPETGAPEARIGGLVDALELPQARRARRPLPVGLGAVELVALASVSRLSFELLDAR